MATSVAVQSAYRNKKQIFSCHYKSFLSPTYAQIRHGTIDINRPVAQEIPNLKKSKASDKSFKNYSKFLKDQRDAARRTVFIQTHNHSNAYELFSNCQMFGKVVQMFHYENCVQTEKFLVEFESHADVETLLNNCRHFNTTTIPIHSKILYFLCQPQHKLHLPQVTIKKNEILTDNKFTETLCKASSISNQMELIYQMLRLNEVGERFRHFITLQVEESFYSLFPTCKIYPFGSSTNSFGKSDCDLDMCFIPTTRNHSGKSRFLFKTKKNDEEKYDKRFPNPKLLVNIADIIQNMLPCCVNVQRILKARVPIIKFQHSDVNCDLSLSNTAALAMSELLYTFGQIDSRVRPLVFTIRKWAASNHLTKDIPGHTITNFVLTVMVIFFLQNRNPPILPSINELLKLPGNTLYNFERIPKPSLLKNTETLEDLLYDFFYFYEAFDFKTLGISLSDASTFTKPAPFPLYIQYPYDLEYNVSRNVSFEELKKIIKVLQISLKELDNSKKSGGKNWGILKLFNLESSDKNDNISSLQMKSLFEKSQDDIELINRQDMTYNNGVILQNSTIVTSLDNDISIETSSEKNPNFTNIKVENNKN